MVVFFLIYGTASWSASRPISNRYIASHTSHPNKKFINVLTLLKFYDWLRAGPLLRPVLDLSNFSWGGVPSPPSSFPSPPFPPLPLSPPSPTLLPSPLPLPPFPSLLSLLPSLPLLSTPLEVGPLFAARGCGGAFKLPHRVRAEPGRQTFSAAF